MQCEKCSNEHDGSYASGRFCSSKCARSFATHAKRYEINDKVSAKRSRTGESTPAAHRRSHRTAKSYAEAARDVWSVRRADPGYFNTLKTDGSRRKFLIDECGTTCAECGLTKWRNLPMPVQLDHIDGNPENNVRENCRLLCPNCHALTPTYCGRNMGRISNSKRRETFKRFGRYR